MSVCWSSAGTRPTGYGAKIELHSGFSPIVTGKLTKSPFLQVINQSGFVWKNTFQTFDS
jgi:hypothetical protein